MIKKCIGFIIKFFNSYFQKSIKNKMIIAITFSLIIPLTIVTLLSFTRASNSMEEAIIKSNTKAIKGTGKFIDKTISLQNDALFTFLVDQNLSSNVDRTDDSNYMVQSDSKNYIYGKMTSLLYSNNNYNGLIFFNESKMQIFYVSDETKNYSSELTPTNEIWYSNSINHPVGTIINDSNFIPKDLNFARSQKDKSFFVFRRLTEFTNKFNGVIFLNVKWKIMNDILDILKTEDESDVLITDLEGNIAYNPYGANADKPEIKEAIKLIKKDNISENSYIKTKEYSVFYCKIANSKMLALKIVPNKFIVKGAKGTLNISILIIIISLILCVLIAIAIAYETTKPIRRLSSAMKGIRDNQLISLIPTGRLDEIGVLEQSYSFMIEKIKNLIENEYKIKMEKRTAQLKALQAQINPHFLNNSLQLIGGIAISKNVPEIYVIIKAISNMFFYSIKINEELVPLQQEILYLKDYLLIQQSRFTDRIDVELNIDESLNLYVLPKLIIQPIVENAFRHGLEKKTGLWKLSISALRIDNNLNIIVTDNGVGIDENKLQQINSQLVNNLNSVFELGESMGVKNVDARLKLYFGSEYGIKISSEQQKGTTVILTLAAFLKGEIK
ncbi:MAG: histidine kinase [Clostridiaceae bacterium]|nr:histidine kinase [Clostridiaceae bacterium]